MTHVTEPDYDLDSFRGRTNVTDPSGVNAAFDAGDTAINTNWTQAADTLFRVRFVIQQTNSGADDATDLTTEFLLQYQVNTGGYADVTGSSAVQFAAATGFANHDDTTQVLGSGSFVTGDGLESSGATDSITFTSEALSETEVEVALSIDSAQVSDADTVNLRFLWSNGDESPPASTFNRETNIPALTVDVPSTDPEPGTWLRTYEHSPRPNTLLRL